ncbi:MAG: hypothetical protein CVT92_01650 [Bacteroidetes bacterium HGW-Bacteroidetes-1]|jgi:uncharacterized membrane protein HdeD (DUF308 family)|nr:MAG: hypothetical protein CVT92_01650 [Bacteroidetes bacterium HGW-Bacteroidetes-1]
MTTLLMRNWGIYLLNGLIAILYGVLALFVPTDTLLVVAWYTGLIILLSGILFLLIVINRIRKEYPYGWMLGQSLIYLITGALILVYTNETIHFFISAIGVLAILAGILQLIVLVNIDPSYRNKNIMLLNALVTLAFGILMLFNPFSVAHFLVVLSGIMALFFGSMLVWFSISLHKIQKQVHPENDNVSL